MSANPFVGKAVGGGEQGAADANDVRRSLALLCDPAHTVEIRGLPVRGSRVHRGDDIDGMVRSAEELSGGLGVYFTLNPLSIPVGANRHAKKPDAVKYRNLLIDFDAQRAVHTNATDAEKDLAAERAVAVLNHLWKLGWPQPVQVDSGNGWHLIYRIDLPNDDVHQKLVRSVLHALGSQFDDEAVTVDRRVHNADRICKLPGTWARKGPHSPARPHRLARLIHAPARMDTVTEAQLRALVTGGQAEIPAVEAPDHPEPKDFATPPNPFIAKASNESASTDLIARAEAYIDACAPAISGQGGHPQTLSVARGVVWGFALGAEEGFRLLWARYNPRCNPPWNEKELRHKCEDADKPDPNGRPRGYLADEGAAPSAAPSDPKDARVPIDVTPNEHHVVTHITNALASAELFVRGDGVVYPVRTPPPPQVIRPSGAVVHPEGSVILKRAATALIRNRITQHCYLRIRSGEGKWRQVAPSNSLCDQVLACPGAIRHIDTVFQGPTIDHLGRLVNRAGYDAETRSFLAHPVVGLKLPESPTLDDARKAADVLSRLVIDFPFEEEGDRIRYLTLLLSACARHLIDRTPLGLITANAAGSGKTFLSRILSLIAHGRDPVLMVWPQGSDLMSRGDEIRKRLVTLLSAGASMALIDNLPRGEDFGCPEIDGFLTSNQYSDRQLGRNTGEIAGGYNRVLLLATGNNVSPCGDTADRTLLVRLRTNDPSPRSRSADSFRLPDLESHLAGNRSQYLGAALTIWRAWILAGKPCPAGVSWGSFEGFVASSVAIVRWLGLGDPIADRESFALREDPELMSLRSLLSLWPRVVGTDWVTATTILSRLGGGDSPSVLTGFDTGPVEAFREALSGLGLSARWPPGPTVARLAKRLAGHAGRVVELEAGKRLILRRDVDKHAKVSIYRVEEIGDDGTTDQQGF